MKNAPARINSFTYEDVDPFDTRNPDLWIKVEHLGRYIFAREYLKISGDRLLHLDLGTGTGYGIEILKGIASQTIGIDYDERALLLARERLQQRSDCILLKANLDTESLAVVSAPVLHGRLFDSATVFEFLEHLNDPGSVLESLSNMMAIGAPLLVSVPNERFEARSESGAPANVFHDHIFSKREIVEMLEHAGFRIQCILGQALVNEMLRNEKAARRRNKSACRLSAIEALHQEKEILALASSVAIPNEYHVDESYAYVFVATRSVDS